VPTPKAGGAERVFMNLARGLTDAGYTVDLLLARKKGLRPLPAGVRVVSFGADHVAFTLGPLARYLRARQPDVLFPALFTPNVVSVLAGRLARVATKIVITEHTVFSQAARHATGLKAKLLMALARRAYPCADGFVAVSNGAAADLAHSISVARERIEVIHNPIVTPELRTAVQRVPTAFPRHNSPPAAVPLVLGVGRLAAHKDFATLIEAFARLRERRPARLVLLGEGDRRAQLEDLVACRELHEDVQMPGFVDDPYDYYRAASVLVLSSRWEGFGNVLVEAMAFGTPVVSTSCPGGPVEILQNGAFGPLVPVGDGEALADALEGVLDAPPPASKLQQRARNFGLKRAVEAYRAVIEEHVG
jgi:glycosyltransferase involved in cell wall biosynthesis